VCDHRAANSGGEVKSRRFSTYGGALDEVDVELPAPQGAQVVVEVDACGVCHSDVHLWEGYFDLGDRKLDLSRGRDLPFTLGHEIAGRVVAAGPDAGAAPGESVVVYPWVGCGDCAMCAAGDEQLCPRPRAIGINVDGGYAERVLVPHSRYLHPHGDVPATLAATYACSGLTAFAALRKLEERTGDGVLVVGAGGVGLAGIAIARALDIPEIIAADIDPAKLAAAREAGAHHTIDTAEPGAVKQVMRLTGGGVAAAVDFVGSASSASFAVGALGRRGKVIVVGLLGGTLPLAVPLLPLKSISLEGSYVGNPDEMAELIRLAQTGRLEATPIETRPLAEAEQAVRDLRDGRVVGRVVLTPGRG
jgi:D-arabinose 1-dehydrogenase-like Zn-dependent alcohol dehydrogenase